MSEATDDRIAETRAQLAEAVKSEDAALIRVLEQKLASLADEVPAEVPTATRSRKKA